MRFALLLLKREWFVLKHTFKSHFVDRSIYYGWREKNGVKTTYVAAFCECDGKFVESV